MIFVLSFIFGVSSALSSALELDFPIGKQFCRLKVNSPVLIEYSDNIHVVNYDLFLNRSGFAIYTRKMKEDGTLSAAKDKQVGYITYNFNQSESYIEISWVNIMGGEHRKGYATHAVLTFLGAMRARRPVSCASAQWFYLETGTSNQAMIKVAEKAGFTRSIRFWHPELMVSLFQDHTQGEYFMIFKRLLVAVIVLLPFMVHASNEAKEELQEWCFAISSRAPSPVVPFRISADDRTLYVDPVTLFLSSCHNDVAQLYKEFSPQIADSHEMVRLCAKKKTDHILPTLWETFHQKHPMCDQLIFCVRGTLTRPWPLFNCVQAVDFLNTKGMSVVFHPPVKSVKKPLAFPRMSAKL